MDAANASVQQQDVSVASTEAPQALDTGANRRTRGVIVHLLPELLTHLKTVAHADGVFYSDVVLDALERFWTDIDEAWALRERGHGLPPRGRRSSGDPRMQVQLRFAPAAVAVLDRRVLETGAPSRNSLINKLLELDREQGRGAASATQS